jgi:hypothetical protein
MTEHSEQGTASGHEPSFSVVTIPEDLREKVIDYVKELSEDSDTSAYMLSLGGTHFTGTECRYVHSGDRQSHQQDVACSDWY